MYHLAMLTSNQVAHFETFGYVCLPQLLSPDEAAVIKQEAEQIMAEARGGGAPDDQKWQAVQPFFERKPFLSQLPADDRIYGIGQSLFGPDFFLIGTEGNLHVGDTPWHGALEDIGLPSVKIAFYVDTLTKETGCLRVIPGTHRGGDPDRFAILRNRSDDPDFRPFGVAPADVPCVALESRPGDVVAFTEHLLHASFGGGPGRHQHAVSFMPNPTTQPQIEFLTALHKRFRFALHPARSYIQSDNPRLQRIVSPLVELGFESSDV